ncbi:hypothetical protein D0Y65_015016 [Glycine soja]|uniref:Uncharacterized protein n=2 Tax=Glycine subgen. Soja TaxID=1462606 RepID=K7KVN9_SOYBN|nr:hypothetical protein D0Y65_015016 [Glycine soja]
MRNNHYIRDVTITSCKLRRITVRGVNVGTSYNGEVNFLVYGGEKKLPLNLSHFIILWCTLHNLSPPPFFSPSSLPPAIEDDFLQRCTLCTTISTNLETKLPASSL